MTAVWFHLALIPGGDPYRPSVRTVATYRTRRRSYLMQSRNLDPTETWAGAACVHGYRMFKQQQ